MPFGGTLDKLHKALATVEGQAYEDALSVLNAILPDNANFTADDAAQWERRLGIYADSSTSLADRMAAIKRKYRHPGTQIPRQHWRYIESQLHAAGFTNAYIYENKFAGSLPGTYVTMTPDDIFGTTTDQIAVYHGSIEYGTIEYGGVGFPKVVNYLEADKDAQFLEGSHLRNTFFVAGSTITTKADIPAAREIEFRQLLITLKPQHMVGYMWVNYV